MDYEKGYELGELRNTDPLDISPRGQQLVSGAIVGMANVCNEAKAEDRVQPSKSFPVQDVS